MDGSFAESARIGPDKAFDQELSPLYIGEDADFVLRGSTQEDPTNWAVKFTVIPQDGTTASVTSPTITRTVSGTAAPYVCAFTIPLSHAQTELFEAGSAEFQFERTDSGSKTILADGTIDVLTPPEEIA